MMKIYYFAMEEGVECYSYHTSYRSAVKHWNYLIDEGIEPAGPIEHVDVIDLLEQKDTELRGDVMEIPGTVYR
jgi:hypothetical protein